MKKNLNLLTTICLLISLSLKAQQNNLDTYLKGEVSSGRLIGVHGLVYQNGKMTYNQFYGQKDKEAVKAMEGNELYFLQSMTKPIVSVALMTLFEDGKFQLNDPIEKYLPEFKDMKVVNDPNLGSEGGSHPAKNKITIAQLLSHTSGLSHGLTTVKMDREVWDTGLNPNLKTVGERVAALAKLPLLYEPGTKWNYSFSTDVVSRLIEVLSGINTAEFLKKRIFEPLGMNNTAYNLTEIQQKNVMKVYDFYDGKNLKPAVIQPKTSGVTLFAGVNALFGTTDDYLKFAKMLVNGGEFNGKRILKKETLQLMTKDVTEGWTNKPKKDDKFMKLANGIVISADGSSNLEPGYGFGLGFGIVKDAKLAGRSELANGEFFWSGANSTYFFVNPKLNLVAIFMTQIGFLPNPNPYHFYYGDAFRTAVYKDLKF